MKTFGAQKQVRPGTRSAASASAGLAPLEPGGFTLTELLAVLAVVGLGLLLLVPARAQTKLGSQAFRCFNNNRMLALAWRMYSHDSRDLLPYSSDDGTGSAQPLNQYAWTQVHLDFNPANRAAWDINAGTTTSPLWPYLKDPGAYKCPADTSYITFAGARRPRVRSFSMNLFLGGFSGNGGGWGFAEPFAIYLRSTDLDSRKSPGPAQTFVFLDQREDSINWGNFMTMMTGYTNQPALYQLTDLPGIYHNGASTVSFGDGHAIFRRWLDPRTTPPMSYGTSVYAASTLNCPNNPDVAWLQTHATRPK